VSLSSEVQARIPASTLRELTNQGSTGVVAINTTVLDAAAADAAAEFELEVGLTFDATDARHVAAGVQGVLYYLHLCAGPPKRELADALRERWERAMAKLATTLGGEARLLPRSGSTLDPTQERSGARPDHDRARWRDYVVGLRPDVDDPLTE